MRERERREDREILKNNKIVDRLPTKDQQPKDIIKQCNNVLKVLRENELLTSNFIPS